MDTNQPVTEAKQKFNRRDYMREYSKKRYHENKEETALKLQKKREKYHANKPEKPKDVVTHFDIVNLKHYYYRCLLLDPAAVAKLLVDFGVPEMPEHEQV